MGPPTLTTSDPLKEDGISLYVHIPFCVHKCGYCDFNSWALPNPDYADFVDTILIEAKANAVGLKPQTVFFGGGTPSILPPPELSRLLVGLDEICQFRESACEVSMEANPESFSPELAAAAFDGGVNRISIGIQSLRKDVLECYERAHSAEQALGAIELAKAAGFTRINADLIYAFPSQQIDEWFEDLQTVMDAGVNHLSCYELTLEEGTPLTKKHEKGEFPCADLDFCAELFIKTQEFCKDRGFTRYEVSNFSKPNQECLHNLVYWRSLSWVGLGPGATTWKDNVRDHGPSEPMVWNAAVKKGECSERCDASRPENIIFDCFMMGLRLEYEGVDMDRVQRISGLDPREYYYDQLRLLKADGLIEFVGNRVRATPMGFRLLDTVLKPLLPSFKL